MKAYVGTKLIYAEPMDRFTFLKEVKNIDQGKSSLDKNEDGYFVMYENGYRSWSPKEVFEKAYRLISPDEAIVVSENLPNYLQLLDLRESKTEPENETKEN